MDDHVIGLKKVDKLVLCPACDKPIHIDEWGGVVNIDGKSRFIHNNMVCLMWLAKRLEKREVTRK
jgi:hypothetical protein